MIRPVQGTPRITTEFGVADSNALFKRHSGVDYAVPTGSNVLAPVSGTVTYAKQHPVRGLMVGIFDGTNTHRLMHNSKFAVGEGTRVNEGQLVALSGSTGLSTGPHVHWDIIRGNKMDAGSFGDFIDPASLLFANKPAPAPAPVQDVLQPWQRRTRMNGNGVNRRQAPSVNSAVLEEFTKPNDVFDFKGYVRGEAYSGNNIWFVGRYGTPTYFWSGSFSDPGTTGLPDLTDQLFPPQAPNPTPPVVQYSQRPSVAGLWAVDVSNHQKSLDFNALKQQGIEIVIMKVGHTGASYGGNALKNDPLFTTFQRDARAAGLAVGYYWFCYFDENPTTEAERFVASLGERLEGEPLFADLEDPDHPVTREWVQTFIETVERLSGQWCHIYTFTNFLRTHTWLHEFLANRKLWGAHYDIPAGAMEFSPVMHQYTSKGALRGVGSQYIDLNVFFGSLAHFKQLGALVARNPEPSQPTPTPDKEPVPVEEPPAPLPTPDNNPIRPKVKAAGIAGLILTVALALLNAFYPGNVPTEAEAAPIVSAATTLIMFGVAYYKRDGLSPK